MATQAQRLTDLALAMATELKKTRVLLNGNAGDNLSALTTTDKSNLVAALNSLKATLDTLVGAAMIDDTLVTSGTRTYSITKIRQTVTDAVNSLLGGAPAALDTLAEFAAAIGNDSNFAATITAALTNRVRVDTATQALTTEQKANARANIGAVAASDIGNPDTDYVSVFSNGLL